MCLASICFLSKHVSRLPKIHVETTSHISLYLFVVSIKTAFRVNSVSRYYDIIIDRKLLYRWQNLGDNVQCFSDIYLQVGDLASPTYIVNQGTQYPDSSLICSWAQWIWMDSDSEVTVQQLCLGSCTNFHYKNAP